MVYYVKPRTGHIIDIGLLDISSGRAFNFAFIIDKVSISFSALVTFISACVFLFARTYIRADLFYYRFIWILLSFVISINLLILSGSFLTLLVGWDGLGVSSFALIIYYQRKESWTAGFLTLLINRLGDIIIMGLLFFFAVRGYTLLVNYPGKCQFLILILLSVAALTKRAQYPFSVWLPAAIAAPTPVRALVHSSTLVTAGIYIIIRASASINLPSEVLTLLLFCGSVTSVLGGLCAIVENDIKKIIALSTLSQLGVMVFSLGLGSYRLALLHLYAHAIFKALLFLVAGAILILSFGIQDIRLLGGVTKKVPLLLVFINIRAFCLIGLPFVRAFYSKHVIIRLMWTRNVNLMSVVLILLRTGLTGFYIIRLIKAVNWGSRVNILVQPTPNLSFYLPLCFLFFGSLSCGLLFYTMDAHLPLFLYLPNKTDLALNISVLMGILIRCLYINRRHVLFLTNMFYLSPLWYRSPQLYYTLSSKIKWLDRGWLEPYMVNYIFSRTSRNLYNYRAWPNKDFGLIHYTAVLMGVGILLWVYLR